ncbi:MAG: ATP-binding protein, partial [Actinomycetes bacterium]
FRLLTGGSRTALPRHRTLHAVVAWSWDLLSDDERLLLERLSVVPGSCTEDAAEAIAGFEARELLAALVDKSLLQPVGAGEPRYRMLETIREYGLEQLARRAEVDTVRARHAAFFLELAEAADRHLRTRDQLPWLARLVVERDNLLAALRWTIERGDGTAATRFGAALCWFWSLQGDPPEAVDLLGRVLTVDGPAEPEGRALVVAAHALGVAARGGSDEVEAAFGRIAPAITGTHADGHPLLEQARMAAAIAAPDPVPDTFPADPNVRTDPWSRASGLLFRGQLARYRGDVAAATELLARALTGFEELGERWGTATALSTLEPVLRLGGDLDGVRGMHERATR